MFTTRVAITIPKRTNDGMPKPEVLERIQEVFARAFGGVTCQEVSGAWINAAGVLVHDDSILVYSYTDDKQKATGVAQAAALYVKDALSQESVLYSVENAQAVLC
jgi:hypothetical protein